jgi:predicted DNA-binding transcriptional regulator AlpA
MRGIPATEVARRLGVSKHWVYQCLNGRVPVPVRFQIGVAAILGLPVDACFRPSRDEVAA